MAFFWTIIGSSDRSYHLSDKRPRMKVSAVPKKVVVESLLAADSLLLMCICMHHAIGKLPYRSEEFRRWILTYAYV